MTDSSITQHVWVLAQLAGDDGNLTDALPDVEATLEFAEDRVGGSASCNRFTTSGELTELPDAMALTMMMCPEPVMAQERRYLALLHAIESVEIDGGLLVARDTADSPILIWRANQSAI
ncbi:MAG: META domain-containing protein [Acidimicrobiia bacterium]